MNVIKEAIRTLATTGDELYSVVGLVSSIDETAGICTVTPLNGDAPIDEVRMRANDNPGWMIVPVDGTEVVVTFIGQSLGYLALVSVVEKLVLEIDGMTFELNEKGLKLINDSTSFKDQLNGLIGVVEGILKALETFKVITPSGPSTAVTPDSLEALLVQKNSLSQVKTNFQKLLA